MNEVLTECPSCNELCIRHIVVEGVRVVKRGFTGKKGKQWMKGSDRLLDKVCPKCNKDVEKRLSHQERIEHLKKSGIPLRIEEKL